MSDSFSQLLMERLTFWVVFIKSCGNGPGDAQVGSGAARSPTMRSTCTSSAA